MPFKVGILGSILYILVAPFNPQSPIAPAGPKGPAGPVVPKGPAGQTVPVAPGVPGVPVEPVTQLSLVVPFTRTGSNGLDNASFSR